MTAQPNSFFCDAIILQIFSNFFCSDSIPPPDVHNLLLLPNPAFPMNLNFADTLSPFRCPMKGFAHEQGGPGAEKRKVILSKISHIFFHFLVLKFLIFVLHYPRSHFSLIGGFSRVVMLPLPADVRPLRSSSLWLMKAPIVVFSWAPPPLQPHFCSSTYYHNFFASPISHESPPNPFCIWPFPLGGQPV